MAETPLPRHTVIGSGREPHLAVDPLGPARGVVYGLTIGLALIGVIVGVGWAIAKAVGA